MRGTSHRTRRRLTLLVCVWPMWLAGCGDDEPLPAVAITAGADSAAVEWNAGTPIDVLANDRASRGALALASADGAAHGTLAITGGRVVYTPAMGYFGTDRFTYTARADDGATASAAVDVTVQARLKLSGNVTDAPLANAAVTATVGKRTYDTVADVNGNYTVAVGSSDPADFVSIEAAGTGAQSTVRLLSLVGGVGDVAAAADAAGIVSAPSLPSLNVSHFTTATAVLAQQANGGKLPTTPAEYATALRGVIGGDLLRVATLIKMVADEGVPLPSGVPHTLALVSDPARVQSFTAQLLKQDWDKFQTVQRAVLAQASADAKMDALVAAGDRTLVYLSPRIFAGRAGEGMVTYRADGTASVVYQGLRPEARWVRDAAQVTLTFDAPITFISVSPAVNCVTCVPPFSDAQFTVQDTVTGIVVRHFSGNATGGMASLALLGSQVYLDGPLAGQLTPQSSVYGEPETLGAYVDLAQRLPIDAGEVAAGQRFGGVVVGFPDAGGFQRPVTDILRIDGPGSGRLELADEAVSWTLADGWLTVQRADGQRFRHTRLLRNADFGQDVWVVIADSGPAPGSALAVVVMRADAGAAFDAATVARVWRFGDLSAESPDQPSDMAVYADGTANHVGQAHTWTLDAKGMLTLVRLDGRGQKARERRFVLLARNGDIVYVLEHTTFYFTTGTPTDDVYRVRALIDRGPATKS